MLAISDEQEHFQNFHTQTNVNINSIETWDAIPSATPLKPK